MRNARVITAALAGWMLASTLFAQQARIFGVVSDESGNPLEGVAIHVTSPDSSFDLELETGKKGSYRINVIDATRRYHFRFSKPGYISFDKELKLDIGLNERRDITLVRGQDPVEAAAANPAIEAFNAGAEAFAQGDALVAREKFDEAIRLDPTLAPPHAAVARLEFDDGRFAEAAAAAEAALALEPGNLLALRMAVAAYAELGATEKLAAANAALAGVDPTAAAGQLYVEGAQLYNEGKTGEAIEVLGRALEVDPQHAKSHYLLGLCLSGQSDRVAEAKEHLQTFLELAPDDVDAALAREMLKYLN